MTEERLYTREEVLEAIREAFYDGLEQGGEDYGGDCFIAENYLPEEKEEERKE